MRNSPFEVRFLPIDIERHAELCVEFRRDSFVCSFGTDAAFERDGGAEGYLAWLRARAKEVPEGIVHVWRGERIVGQLEMRVRAEPYSGYVNLFYLVPGERGSGLGADLFRYTVRVFERRGVSCLRLSVSPTNARALKYYEKCGFSNLGPAFPGAPVHTMELLIKDERARERA